MSKRTLLELTQDILSSMDSDEVNSITDTVESLQVATIIRTVYEDILNSGYLPETYSLFNLGSSGSPSLPCVMYKPSNTIDILWLKYNKYETGTQNPAFQKVNFLPLEEFFDYTNQFSSLNDNTGTQTLTINGSSITFSYKNDKHPLYYSSFDDSTIIFDSYFSDYDTTLQGSKTIAYGQLSSTWENSDTFIPTLDEREFSLLYNEAKSLAWAEIKQTENRKAEQAAKRGWVTLQKGKQNIESKQPQIYRAPDYGRKRY